MVRRQFLVQADALLVRLGGQPQPPPPGPPHRPRGRSKPYELLESYTEDVVVAGAVSCATDSLAGGRTN